MKRKSRLMRGIIRTVRALGDRNQKYRQTISPDLRSHNRRVRQIRTAGLSVDLLNEKHEVEMPMPNASAYPGPQ
jgi:hypothetical protein